MKTNNLACCVSRLLLYLIIHNYIVLLCIYNSLHIQNYSLADLTPKSYQQITGQYY